MASPILGDVRPHHVSADPDESAMALLALSQDEVEVLIATGEKVGVGWESLVTRIVRQFLKCPVPPRYDVQRIQDALVEVLRCDPDRTEDGRPLWSDDELAALRVVEWMGNAYTIDQRGLDPIARITWNEQRRRWMLEEVGSVAADAGLDRFLLVPSAAPEEPEPPAERQPFAEAATLFAALRADVQATLETARQRLARFAETLPSDASDGALAALQRLTRDLADPDTWDTEEVSQLLDSYGVLGAADLEQGFRQQAGEVRS